MPQNRSSGGCASVPLEANDVRTTDARKGGDNMPWISFVHTGWLSNLHPDEHGQGPVAYVLLILGA